MIIKKSLVIAIRVPFPIDRHFYIFKIENPAYIDMVKFVKIFILVEKIISICAILYLMIKLFVFNITFCI